MSEGPVPKGIESLPNRLLTVVEAAAYLSISRSTLYRLIEAGKLAPIRITYGRLAFRISDLDRFAEARRTPEINSGE